MPTPSTPATGDDRWSSRPSASVGTRFASGGRGASRLHHPIVPPPDQGERRLAGGSYRSPIIQGRVAIARWSPRVSMPAFGGTHQIVR
jgi:hypothetical protein